MVFDYNEHVMNFANPAFQQFVSVALPIMVTLMVTVWTAQWSQNKRFDNLNKRFDDLKADMNRRFADIHSDMIRRFDSVERRFDRIEKKLDDHDGPMVAEQALR